ncbi:MAG: DsrE family protein [Gammaproteobacteria bacterium]|nr:DsrE family protein [Gammaproteobacteria bacterium]
MKFSKLVSKVFAIAAASAILAVSVSANSVAADFDPKYKIVIQVSSDDAQTQTIALNNAVNLQQEYGLDNIAVEVVAYGPGLGLLTKGNKQSDRVKSLATQNITFSACGNTMKKVKAKTGKDPVLTEGVQVVKAGVGRIMELQMAGYSYVRP